MLNAGDVVGLMFDDQRRLKIDNGLIQTGLNTQLPWTEPNLRAVQISKAVFAPMGDEAFLLITGSVQAPDLIIKGVRAPIEIGFGLKVGGKIRYEADGRHLFLTVTTVEITDFNPAEGFGLAGDLGMMVLGLGGRAIAGTGRAVGRGASSLWQRVPSIPRPRLPKRFRRKKDDGIAQEAEVSTPAFEQEQAAAIEKAGGVSSVAEAIKEKLKGMIIAAVNSYLAETPIYQLPAQHSGVDIDGVVEDVCIEGGQVTVQLNMDKSPQLRAGRRWLKIALIVGGIIIAGGLVGWGVLIGGMFQ